MNHTYRLVWNDLINAFVAVSELTKGRGKRTSNPSPASGRGTGGEESTRIDHNTPLKLTLLAVATAAATLAQAADPLPTTALPTGAQLAAGQASVAQTGTRMDITQSSDRAILNWQSFNIGQSAHVNFNQPSASAVTLNRVVGGDPSQILGRMTANGQVFLSNPNGIYFGKNAQIDVAGLVATTHNIRDHDFMAGRNDFTIPGNPGASVINEGQIRIADTGIAAFVAPSVANRGVIAAKLGKIQLAAANGFTLDFHGDDLLTFMVDDKVAQIALNQNGQPLNSFVESSGRIEAEGGYVWLTAKAAEGAVHSAINHSGVVEANRVDNQGGVIVLSGGEHGLVTVSGKLDASGQGNAGKGGEISITGETVHLVANATLDASGQEGGGTILVGGDHMGGNLGADAAEKYSLHLEKRSIANAKNVLVEEGVVLNASALERGDGGKVVIWADDATEFRGDIFARGGDTAGNGGIVEISGGKRVVAQGFVDVTAPAGMKGLRLIDPFGSLYASTQDYFDELINYNTGGGVVSVRVTRENNDDVLYILSTRVLSTSVYRVDVFGYKHYPSNVIVTKIVGGNIVAQSIVDTLYSTSDFGTNSFNISGYFGSMNFVQDNISIFFSEKSDGGSLDRNGYIYTLDKNSLNNISKAALFQGGDLGYYPIVISGGEVRHHSRYNDINYINLSPQGGLDENDAYIMHYSAKASSATFADGVSYTHDGTELDINLVLLYAAQRLAGLPVRYIGTNGQPVNDINNSILVGPLNIPGGITPNPSNPGRPGTTTNSVNLCRPGDVVCAGGNRIGPDKHTGIIKTTYNGKEIYSQNFWSVNNLGDILAFLSQSNIEDNEDNAARIIFAAIRKGFLVNDKNDPLWGELKRQDENGNRVATNAQITANIMAQAWVLYGGLSADELFLKVIAGNLKSEPSDLKWQALYQYDEVGNKIKEGNPVQSKVAEMVGRYRKIDKLLDGVLDSEYEEKLTKEADNADLPRDSIEFKTLLGAKSYKEETGISPVANSILDTAVFAVGNNKVTLTSYSSGLTDAGLYNYDHKGTQCVDLVKSYVQSLSGTFYSKTGHGMYVAGFLDGKSAGEGMIFKTYPNISSTPPIVGSVISGEAGANGIKNIYGHVAVVKGVKYTDNNTIELTLIENNFGNNGPQMNAGEDVKNRKVILKKDDQGNWSGKLQDDYPMVSWANPEEPAK